MTASRPSDTKARIQAVARELFAQRGIQQTSLREIADRLGITKPALYYHFDSREALVRSIVQPMLDAMEEFAASREATARPEPRALLSDYFDMMHEHQDVLALLVGDLGTLGELDLTERIFEWRRRFIALVVGPEPTLAAQARAVVAIGGLSDCAVAFPGVAMEKVKAAAVEAACAALGLPPRATKRRAAAR